MRPVGPNEHTALVRVDGVWHFVVEHSSLFILDYARYDPNSTVSTWRGGLRTVRPTDGERYLRALAPALQPIEAALEYVSVKDYNIRPIVTIDFDQALFVSAYFDNSENGYVGEGWTFRFEDPLEYGPAWLAAAWPFGDLEGS